MKQLISTAVVAALAISSGVVHAQANIESNLDASLRLGLELRTEPDAELVWEDYDSRIRWTGGAELQEGFKGISYLEFGFDQEEGVNETRQAWVGVETEYGTLKGGKQYTAFFDAVTSVIDVDIQDGCVVQIACDRQASTLKYVSPLKGDLQFLASANLGSVALGGGDDFIDGLELAATMQRGDLKLGAGIILDLEGDTGAALGVSAAMPYANGTASATVQFQSEDAVDPDVAAAVDDGIFSITGAYKQEDLYASAFLASVDDVAFELTGGYILPIVDDVAFIYFEAGVQDIGVDGFDTNLFGRGVFVYNFDVFKSAGT